jgi:hypothetical protein
VWQPLDLRSVVDLCSPAHGATGVTYAMVTAFHRTLQDD